MSESTRADQIYTGLHSADGIVHVPSRCLARDPSLVVGYPYPPGDDFLYVDDVLQIRPGDRIIYSTEAENDPAEIQRQSAQLHVARQQLRLAPKGTPMREHWATQTRNLMESLMDYQEGVKRIKSMRTVLSVDKAKNLIVVTESFKFSYKPRVLGGVCRVVGFIEDLVDEPGSDKLHKNLVNIYGTNWESEYLDLILPTLNGRDAVTE